MLINVIFLFFFVATVASRRITILDRNIVANLSNWCHVLTI